MAVTGKVLAMKRNATDEMGEPRFFQENAHNHMSRLQVPGPPLFGSIEAQENWFVIFATAYILIQGSTL